MNRLVLWQKAMNLTESCEPHRWAEAYGSTSIQPLVCHIERGPKRGLFPAYRHLWLSNGKVDGVKDFVVLDPKMYAGDEKVEFLGLITYWQSPYVWSKNWEEHERIQVYSFVHPNRGGEWAFGEAARGLGR